jgi:hypothetical protein
MATLGISLSSSALKAGLALLAQHTARVKDATNENQAVNQIVPAFDQDVAEIVAAYNAGTYSPSECITALEQVDAQMESYLKANVGPTGTAWDGTGKCTRGCTVSCCVFYNDLHSAIYGPSVAPYNGSTAAANGANGLIPVLAAGGGTAYIPTIYGSKYGLTQRPGYSVTVTSPPVIDSALGSLENALGQLTGSAAPLPGGTSGTTFGVSTILLVLGVVLVLVAVFAALKS